MKNTPDHIKKLCAKPSFKTFKIFNEDLTAVLVEYLKDPFKMEMVGSYCLCILVVQCLEGGLNWLLAHARGAHKYLLRDSKYLFRDSKYLLTITNICYGEYIYIYIYILLWKFG